MQFCSNAGEMTRALRASARRHPANRNRDVNLQITARADGALFETTGAAASSPHVAIAGTSIVPRNVFTRVLATFPQRRPITVEASDDYLHIGTFRLDLEEMFRPQGGVRSDLA